MDTCDCLVVGGGPAGSSCARALVQAGLDVLVLDKSRFPRDKVCAGWITPAVVDEVELDLTDYAKKMGFGAGYGKITDAGPVDMDAVSAWLERYRDEYRLV